MNHEDFVTYEQSLKLKQLGFDWECDFIYYFTYHNHSKPIFQLYETTDYYEVEKYWYAPTLSQAQKWLREVKDIHVEIKYTSNPQYEPWVGKVVIIENYPKSNTIINTDTCDTYEEALSEGINMAIEILESNEKDGRNIQ